MQKPDSKPTEKDTRTWTFVPAPDVRRAICREVKRRDARHRHGLRSKLINGAAREKFCLRRKCKCGAETPAKQTANA